jgi:hypothetical protein
VLPPERPAKPVELLNMSQLPPRYQPNSVFRYVSIFKQVLELVTPTRIRFQPQTVGVNATTAEARIRDAAHAICERFVWHPDIPKDRIDEFKVKWKEYKVVAVGDEVLISPRDEPKDRPTGLATVEYDDAIAVLPAHDEDAIRAFAVILTRRYLVGKVRIMGTPSGDLQSQLISSYDVAIMSEADGSWTMI